MGMNYFTNEMSSSSVFKVKCSLIFFFPVDYIYSSIAPKLLDEVMFKNRIYYCKQSQKSI